MIKEVFWTEIQHEKKRDFSWSRSLFLSCIPCYYKKKGKRGEGVILAFSPFPTRLIFVDNEKMRFEDVRACAK